MGMNLQCSIEGCSYLAERNGICSRHNREARKASAPKTKARKARIAKQSEEGKERNEIYHAIKNIWLKEHPICEVHDKVFPDEFFEPPTSEPHHMKGRDGDNLYDIRFWLPVCRRCHERIERNPEWAYASGYSLLRTANEPHLI